MSFTNIYKKEIASYFNGLIGYLAIGLFLLLSGLVLWIFPDTSILDAGYAQLDGFFSIAPYLFLFLIPAIAMRSIAGEKADGTFDLLLSRPYTLKDIVLGKYLGINSIGILSIAPTLIYAISVYLLAYPKGNIDIGATIGSYIGLLFLTSSYAAISIFCSSLTKNPIVSFLLAVFACFLAYYGLDAGSQLAVFQPAEDFIKDLGIRTHYDSISRGVLTAKDLIYFLSLSAIFILFTIGHLGRKFRKRQQTFTAYGIGVALFFILNSTSFTNLFGRIDFTEDKRFTLSNTSERIINQLDENIYITIFLDGDLPSGFARLKQETINMASDLKALSGGKIKFTVIDPLEGNQEEQQKFTQALIERGVFPTNLSVRTEAGFTQKLIFPAAIVSTEDQELTVNLLQQKTGAKPEEALNNSIQNLEYAFISAIGKVVQQETAFIGFTEGHGEPSDLELYDAMHSIMTGNQVGRVNLDSVTYESLQQLKVLFVVKPQSAFSESDKYKIDYFVRNGGRVVWTIDQVDASLDNLRQAASQPLIGKQLNLDDLFFLYGFRLNYNVLADLNCGQIPMSIGNIGGQAQIELVPWYFFPILMPTSANPIVKNLDGIRTEFIGTIDTIETPRIRKEVLLSSSPFARTIATPAPISLQMIEEAPDPAKFKTNPQPVALLLSGKFPYIFENRPAPEGIQQAIDLTSTSRETKMLVFADGDWLINQVNHKDQSPYPLGWDRYTEQQFANKTLLQNIVDYLLNDEEVINLRNREVKLRLLDQAKVKAEKTTWQLINVALPLIVLLLFGIEQQFWRKRKYQRLPKF
ncbi:gliding motility-associated ABC transporter substrate-binding protein GldG [Sphingobacterium wenxiniae]|uniref:Protein involved in gliding motility GldG n=1 Tax=Sphingobacterium wenxiniae TaxID=683125 RepID=A0A1I6VFM8_9SPHI|nr:gliding motility-associated ABC transporter substrate-binding protein GldG [Sphingobacterium wenxiniae]SFT12509.1 protein involved in gliding motility GldG [Sphingobacterium wenxiniae]